MSIQDIFYESISVQICSYLCYIDLQSLRFTCKFFHKRTILPNIRNLIIEKISKYTPNSSDILDVLDEFHCVISGSFMVNILYNADWKFKDIDIYYRDTYPEPNSHKYKNLLVNKLECLIKGETKNNYNGYHTHKIQFKNSHKYVEFICCPVDVIPLLMKSFDMDICKIMYHDNILCVKNWNKLIQRKDIIVPAGFASFDFITRYDNNYEEFCNDKLMERYGKYSLRGFNITLHPDYKKIIKFNKKNIAVIGRTIGNVHKINNRLLEGYKIEDILKSDLSQDIL